MSEVMPDEVYGFYYFDSDKHVFRTNLRVVGDTPYTRTDIHEQVKRERDKAVEALKKISELPLSDEMEYPNQYDFHYVYETFVRRSRRTLRELGEIE